MILDTLKNHPYYAFLGPQFTRAFKYLAETDSTLADARIEFSDSDDYAMIQTYRCKPREECTFEAHQNYIDIQYILSGRECIYYQESSSLVPKSPYDLGRDVTFFEEAPGKPLHLEAGDFVVFWPQDGHQPCCILGDAGEVRKVVVKIRI